MLCRHCPVLTVLSYRKGAFGYVEYTVEPAPHFDADFGLGDVMGASASLHPRLFERWGKNFLLSILRKSGIPRLRCFPVSKSLEMF